MKTLNTVNVINRAEGGYLNRNDKTGFESINLMSAVFRGIVANEGLLKLDMLHKCIPVGLFLENAGGRWELIPTDPGYGECKKIFMRLRKAIDIIINFYELVKPESNSRLLDTKRAEGSPEAPRWVADALCQLRAQKLAGSLSALTMLAGRCVVADWLLDKIYVLEINLLNEHAHFTPMGLGKDFLVAYINYVSWARQSALREPVMAAARRAMQFVADNLRLNRNCYYIEVSTL